MEKLFQCSTIPAGLADDRIEFFILNGEIVFVQSGQLHDFEELCIDEFLKIADLLEHDKKAQKGLDLLNITDPEGRMKKFVFCRFGGNDLFADIEDDVFNSEYWYCGCKPCIAEGLICKFPCTETGKLTRHEVEIMRGIGNDRLNKQIAGDLGISVETVNKECKHIGEKIGVFSKAGIAAFAGKNHIL